MIISSFCISEIRSLSCVNVQHCGLKFLQFAWDRLRFEAQCFDFAGICVFLTSLHSISSGGVGVVGGGGAAAGTDGGGSGGAGFLCFSVSVVWLKKKHRLWGAQPPHEQEEQ